MTTHHLPTTAAVIEPGDLLDLGTFGEWEFVATGDPNQPYAFEYVEEHDCSEDIGFNAGCGDRATDKVDGEWYCEMHAARRRYYD